MKIIQLQIEAAKNVLVEVTLVWNVGYILNGVKTF